MYPLNYEDFKTMFDDFQNHNLNQEFNNWKDDKAQRLEVAVKISINDRQVLVHLHNGFNFNYVNGTPTVVLE